MEILNDREYPETVEIHVRVTRHELENITSDMESDCTHSNPYTATEEFFNYLKRL